MLDILEKEGVLHLRVRVQPGASTEAIGGEYAGAVKLKVTAWPEKGKANRAVREFLAERLGVAKVDVRLVRGARSRDKIFAIDGIGKSELLRRLGE